MVGRLALASVLLLFSVTENAARIILVTGAAKGIGAAISARFAASGDRIILHWRSDRDEVEAVRSSLAPSPEGSHICLQADLAVLGSSAKLVQEAIKEAGAIDVLVCNHGLPLLHWACRSGHSACILLEYLVSALSDSSSPHSPTFLCPLGMYEETPIETTSAEEFSQSFGRVMRTNLHAPAELVQVPRFPPFF